MTRKKNFTAKEIEYIFKLKEANMTWKAIGKIFGTSKATVKSRYRASRLLADLPPKEKLSRSVMAGRLGQLTKEIVNDFPSISYADIPGKLREVYGLTEDLPSPKTFERFLKESGFKRVKL